MGCISSARVYGILLVFCSCVLLDKYCSAAQDGDIRLLGGRSPYEGTVLIYHRRRWGAVCDYNWDLRDSQVVCRQLGYGRAIRAVRRSRFGRGRLGSGDGMSWMTNVRCRGAESRLDRCTFPGFGRYGFTRYPSYRRSLMYYCRRPTSSAGVLCQGPATTTTTTTTRRPPINEVGQGLGNRYRVNSGNVNSNAIDGAHGSSIRVVNPFEVQRRRNPYATRPTRGTTTTTPRPTTTTRRPTTTTRRPTTTTTTTRRPTTTTTTTRRPTTTTTTTRRPTTTTTTTRRPTTTTTTTRRPTTTTTTTPRPTTTTTTRRPTTTTTSTRRPTTTTVNVDNRINNILDNNVLQSDETYHRTNNEIPNPRPATRRPATIRPTTRRPTTTRPTTRRLTTRRPTTRRPTTRRPTTRRTTTRRPTTRRPTTPEPTTQSGTSQEEERTRPRLRANVWAKDPLIKAWVLKKRNGKILIAPPGERPTSITLMQYINKRLVMMGLTTMTTTTTTTTTTPTTTTTTTPRPVRNHPKADDPNVVYNSRYRGYGNASSPNELRENPNTPQIRLQGGRRNTREGRLEVLPPGQTQWGVICGDQWSFKEAIVACKHLGKGFAQQRVKKHLFGGASMKKHYYSVSCKGTERSLSHCQWRERDHAVACSKATSVAGVVCSRELPDLEPDIRILSSAYLEDRALMYLTCSMEENCLSRSAYEIRNNSRDPYEWRMHRRRLLRFSSIVRNIGTADFLPNKGSEDWEWHACHMHYHSMDIFAHYDITDQNGNRLAQGLKASFCLEDSACSPGHRAKYDCVRFRTQGISMGCSDNYMSDIDCQWVDVTDLKASPDIMYKFKMEINPNMLVPEISFENNIVTCDLYYNGYHAALSNCKRGSLL